MSADREEDAGASQDDFELPQVSDGFERLWTPHRLAYVRRGQGHVTDESNCPFCAAPSRSDEQSLIVRRGDVAFVLMNLFPYNAGHLLVCPYRHVADYTDITAEETAEIAALTQDSMRVLRLVAHPPGFNLGINQGNAGGAGIAAHLHQHVVPRWNGDANFLPVIAHTKALSQTLGDMHRKIKTAWSDLDEMRAEGNGRS